MYSCIMCKIDFTSRQHLYKHLVNHKKDFGCMKCDYISRNVKDRKNHSKTHRIINCPTCKKHCEKKHLKEHQKSHEYMYSIDQLNGIVDIIDKIQGNNNNETIQGKNELEYSGTSPICPVKWCNKKFSNPNELINHFIEHRQKHRCRFCQEIFPNTQRCSEHISNKICRYYTCLNCREDFSFEKFIPHIMYKCSENLFDNAVIQEPIQTSNLRKVYRIYDEVQYSFSCFMCENEYGQMQQLHKHLKTHNKQLNVCAKCFCIFGEERELKDHEILGCETDCLGKYEKLSEALTTYLNDYEQRKKYLQTNIKVYEMNGDLVSFQCNVCNSKFVQFKYLTEHCDIHGHELIVCFGCCFMFNTWRELREHFCIKDDYHSMSEMKFRREFRKNKFLIYNNKNETETCTPSTSRKNGSEADVITRMTDMIQELEGIKFPERKDTNVFNLTPSTIYARDNCDEFDLNKILPRVMELRRNRMRKDEVQEIWDDLNNLNICQKHLLNIKHEPHNKRNNDDDYTIENISKFLDEFDEPPNKKIKIDECLDDEDEILDEDALLDSSDDEIPNKLRKY